MRDFAMGPSVAPALHLVALRQHLKRGPLLYNTHDDRKAGRFVVGEENMTCLTNLADSGACQWRPITSRQWIKDSHGKARNAMTRDNEYDLQEFYCAVAQQPELSSQNDQRSDCSDESKSGDAEDFPLSAYGSKSYGLDKSRMRQATAVEVEESTATDKRRCLHVGRQESLDCNQGDLKLNPEKLGWKNAGRHAEDRRKRWAQADPLLDFWKCVSASKYAAPFRRPVALLEDYDLIIRQPMDLSTIRRQLENDESYCLESLRRDLMLMVTNALVYNKKGTDFYEVALKLKNHFMKLFERHQRETNYSNANMSPIDNSTISAAKVAKSKQSMQPSTEFPSTSENLPLAPVKKHRTMRRPRSCISNDANGSRSDMANGAAAMDSSSEEEAAAVLICFSSGKSGGEKQALPLFNSAKPEFPRKKMKRAKVDTDDNSTCSVSQQNDSQSQLPDQLMACSDASVVSAGHPPANSSPGTDTRYLAKERGKCREPAGTGSCQAKRSEGVGLSQSKEALTTSVAGVGAVDAASPSHGRKETQCLGLKHKWQERWLRQSAAFRDLSGTSQQHSETVATQCGGQSYAVEGGSIADVSHRTFPQLLQM